MFPIAKLNITVCAYTPQLQAGQFLCFVIFVDVTYVYHPILFSVPNNSDLQRIPHPRHSIVRQQGRQGRSIQAEWPVAPSLVLKF